MGIGGNDGDRIPPLVLDGVADRPVGCEKSYGDGLLPRDGLEDAGGGD